MKRLLLATAFATLVLSGSALADGHGHGHKGHGDHHDNGRHEGWYKEYKRGDHIDVVYLQPRYYVEDYRVVHLAPPPPGHRWVRYPDGRYILVAVATGIIADILLNH